MMKYMNGQSSQESSFLLNSQTNPVPVRANPKLALQPPPKPLLSYLFEESHQIISQQKPSSEVLVPTNQNLQPSTIQSALKIKRPTSKKRLIPQRVKTDLNEDGGWFETIEELKSQNKKLRQQVLDFQKKIICLESVQMEAEYLAKISLLQQSEIEKLRRILRQANYQQIEEPKKRNSQNLMQCDGSRVLIDGEWKRVFRAKNKQNCTRNASQLQKYPKKRGSYSKEPSRHSKTISDWETVDNSSGSHCKKGMRKNCNRPIQQKMMFRY